MRSVVLARPMSPLARSLRRVVSAGLALAVVIGLWLIYCEYTNSRDVPAASPAQLRTGFARAEAWIFNNKDQILDDNNPMLWLLVRDAGRTTNDRRLVALADEYQTRHTNGTPNQYFFDSSGSEQLAARRIQFDAGWQDYQRLFAYGTTCNASVREDPDVLALLSPAACDRRLEWLRSPWCRTHQLMGLRFVQKNHCEPDPETSATIAAVQDSIVSELHWDFRVEDAYLQMVLTLVESGRTKDVKPIWVRRILDAQRADGGWDGVQVLTRLPGDRVLAWSGGRLYPWIMRRPAPNFHATAQGLYLLALLESGQNK